jgi:hypothetical protein
VRSALCPLASPRQVDYNVSGDYNGRRMQEQLFERLWEDTSQRIRNAGVRGEQEAANPSWGYDQ